MRRTLFILLFHLTPAILYSQVLMSKDSLLKLLPQAKKDVAAVQLYIDIGQQFESNEPDSAKLFYRRAASLSRELNYPKGIIQYINNYTFVLNMQGMYDSSLLLNLQGVAISRETKDSMNLAKTLFNTGSSYRMKGEYEKAVEYYEEGKKLFQKFGNESIEAQSNDILQALYYQTHQYEKGIELGEKSVYLFRKLNNLPLLGSALNNLGTNYVAIDKLDKASSLFKEALTISKSIEDQNLEQIIYLNLGEVCYTKGDYVGLKSYMEKALELAKELELRESELIAIKGLSYYYQFKKDYKHSEALAREALMLSYQFNQRVERQKVFALLSTLGYSKQDITMATYYANQSSLLGDSILNETIRNTTLELEKKYENERKENRISQLEADTKMQQLSIRQKSTLNYILMGGAVTVLIIFLLSYRTYQQKQKLQQHRITELETEKQLTATEGVLKGEEQERSRLAKDLHDGLGGMLSGIKYSLNTMKGNLIMTPENHQAFERSMDMLDSSIKEMRRVAHNMMPEVLVRSGLDVALKDFCNDINQSGALKLSYQSIGLSENAIEQTTAITVYRIVQELINNTMKHAAATSAIVQVTRSNDQISVTVEDNGKGFDTSILNQSKGIGWTNIQNRVDFLKGKLDVQASPGNGTSVLIEFTI
jgi:two-component system, NarL family, sensor kinase